MASSMKNLYLLKDHFQHLRNISNSFKKALSVTGACSAPLGVSPSAT
jgi:hypothetical protein